MVNWKTLGGSVVVLSVAADYILTKHIYKIDKLYEEYEHRDGDSKTIFMKGNNERIHGLLQSFESKFGEKLVFQDHYSTIIELPPKVKANTDSPKLTAQPNEILLTDSNHSEMSSSSLQIKNYGNNNIVDVSHLALSFFTSYLFYLESRMLKIGEPSYGNTEPDEINKVKFQVGDHVSIFKVIERTDSEILMRTPLGTLEWFKISKPQQDDNKIQINFGSGVLKNERLAKNPLFRVSMPLHNLFSKYLVMQTKTNLERIIKQMNHNNIGDD
ncbi:hypothetical protein C9374_003540 [Naegleria lovaniensis]|uniref:Uncharacterized protein n=1 Tax=Naegleria lovaniensis TaxID=51637 RepID=A0AA88GRW1_NAELO|nr:uncharacterized protein C9374_003540 [Naegleria lovaniensis]KAG2385725.1 hypothetical protein C9374_003540 [Naegleria lovaniensis]